MTLLRDRSSSDVSATFSNFSNDDSLYPDYDNNEGSLHPDYDNNALLQSTKSEGSLWRQYSLIAEDYRAQKESETSCCDSDRWRPWILKLSFLIVVGAGLFVCCLEMRLSTYSPKYRNINGGDQILLPTSTYFNKELHVTTNKKNDLEKLKLHVFTNVPRIGNETTAYVTGVRFHMSSWTYQYWGLYLLKGTTVKISVCADLNLQFYILKGSKKLKKWTQEILFNDYDYHTNIHSQPSCDHISKFKSHVMSASESEVYYISFSSTAGWRFLTQVSVLLQFNRTYYDMADLKYSCILSNKTCFSKFQYGSNDITMLEVVSKTSESPSSFHTISLYYEFLPRWSFYLHLFGGIYVVVVIVTVIYATWRLCVSCIGKTVPEREAISVPYKPYALSLHSTAGYRQANKKAWLVVSPTSETSTKHLYEVQERDDISILRSCEEEPERRTSTISRDSIYMRNRRESAFHDLRYRTAQYNNEQQLLDSCMTAAGVSAI